MREIRIYQQGSYQPGDTIELDEVAGQHVGVVLRMRLKDKITLFPGNNLEFSAEIIQIHKKKVIVTILSQTLANKESPKKIHLAQAMGKADKMEWIVQKAVELGVTSITPLLTEYSQVKLDKERLEKKRNQWQAIAIAACEQSGRNVLPIINGILSFDAFLQVEKVGEQYILHPYKAKTWKDCPFAASELHLLIGPEGGFSEKEVETALSKGFNPLSLGPRILRMETAAIASLSLLQAISGDL
ncbi:MAG: 16S rRNA (uracil(1498)-N(3))-methyltransferase [Proteobacteria bacterium]|nr:16S rRNA (uracil(1498)-N(3))-methyltransferase [Pseudomonadota bacterium]